MSRPPDGALLPRLHAACERHARRPAVEAADGRLTYAELVERSARIAALLGRRPYDPRRPLLLLLHPGARFAATVLGALWAGRFFVALDPDSPAGRNAVIVADADAELVVTTSELSSRLADLWRWTGSELPVVDVDTAGSAEPGHAAPCDADAFLALTYTSGSTGRPKGVVQTHRSVLGNALLTGATLGLGPGDRTALLYPPSVNPALRELFTPLLHGATVLPFAATAEGLPALADWLRAARVTTLSCGMTLFRQLSGELGEGRLPGVRRVRLGGEAVTAREVERFRRHFTRPCVLSFGFGATETGTATVCTLTLDDPLPKGVPLGRPAPQVDVRLLAADGGPASEGELVVGSDRLAAGYWRRPALTADRFRPADGGGRAYRTGDLARRHDDGTLHHLGRLDSQVKIRGRRIEVREVEAALETLEGVASAAVAGRPGAGTDGDPELVAWLVADGGRELDRPALRLALARRLPPAMVPARFVVLPALPMTPNGKLDRTALPRQRGRELSDHRSFSYPRDPVETRLAATWCDVLGRHAVGIDESFFDLGGDSLTAVTLFSEIERRFGCSLPLASLFEAPTVARQAERLRDGVARTATAPVVTLNRPLPGPALFCVPAVDGYPFVYRPLARALDGAVTLRVLLFPGLDGGEPPAASVEDLAAQLIRRLRADQPHGPYRLLGHSFGGMVAWEMCRRLQQAGEAVALLALVDSHTRDAVPALVAAVRDAETLLLKTRRLWQEAAATVPAPVRRLGLVAGAVLQVARRTAARRRRNTLVEHTIHAVRRAATAARRRYRLAGRLDLREGRAVLLRAAPGAGQARLWCRLADPANGWRPHVGGLEVRSVPGDHIRMLEPPNVASLAGELIARLPSRSATPAAPEEWRPAAPTPAATLR